MTKQRYYLAADNDVILDPINIFSVDGRLDTSSDQEFYGIIEVPSCTAITTGKTITSILERDCILIKDKLPLNNFTFSTIWSITKDEYTKIRDLVGLYPAYDKFCALLNC